MASDVRQRMIEGAAELLSQGGLQAASFSEVLERTGAPRGSLYHHFPGGKDELVVEAVRHVGGGLLAAMARAPVAGPPEQVMRSFTALWRQVLVGSDLTCGCAIAAVTVELTVGSPELLVAVGAVFRSWHAALTDLLRRGGLTPRRAERLATTAIAAMEGALVLSRAERDLRPFDDVADQLVDLARSLPTRGAAGDRI